MDRGADMDVADSELDPMDRECEDCKAEPGEPCRFNCSSRWTTPPLDDETEDAALVPGQDHVPPRR